MPRNTKTDEFSEKLQTAFDCPPAPPAQEIVICKIVFWQSEGHTCRMSSLQCFPSIDMSAGGLVSKEWFKKLVIEKRLLAFIAEGLLVIYYRI